MRRRAATLASFIALVALVVAALFGDRGMLHLIAQKQKAETLAREIEELRAENQKLATEMAALKADTGTSPASSSASPAPGRRCSSSAKGAWATVPETLTAALGAARAGGSAVRA